MLACPASFLTIPNKSEGFQTSWNDSITLWSCQSIPLFHLTPQPLESFLLIKHQQPHMANRHADEHIEKSVFHETKETDIIAGCLCNTHSNNIRTCSYHRTIAAKTCAQG